MSELEEKLLKCNIFNVENTKSEEIGFFIYKNYIVSVYRLAPIVENDESASFENVYVVYDLNNHEVFDEYNEKRKYLFEVLPQIDDVLFNYSFDNREIVENAKKTVKDIVIKYYNDGEIKDNYIDELKKIYDYSDESSKSFYNFFITKK